MARVKRHGSQPPLEALVFPWTLVRAFVSHSPPPKKMTSEQKLQLGVFELNHLSACFLWALYLNTASSSKI